MSAEESELSYEAHRKIAHESEFELLGASWDIAHGRMVELRVVEKPNEDIPHPFKRFQKRRGGRVGTRFHTVFTVGDAIVFEGQTMLASWGETSNKGLWVKLWMEEEADSHPFAGFRYRHAKTNGEIFYGVFVELDEDEQAVDQAAKDRVEGSREYKLSQYAWRLAHLTPTFIRWLDEKMQKPREDLVWTEEVAHKFIRFRCGIESLADLDHNDEARKIFHRDIRQPYAAWMRNN